MMLGQRFRQRGAASDAAQEVGDDDAQPWPQRQVFEDGERAVERDRKSTRLNSSHGYISYAVFCLKKKNKELGQQLTPPMAWGGSISLRSCHSPRARQ